MVVLQWRSLKRVAIGALLVIAILSLPFAFGLSGDGAGWGTPSESVGLIHLTGTIQTLAEGVIGEESGVGPVIDALNSAREDGRVSAVVVRVNSPGGSAAASQEVHRAILKVREANKPVVVSMADVAASGGYYVAVAADRILANPATITGSIGVYAQFLNVAELADEYGVKLETVKTGPYKDLGNPTQPFTEDERRVMQAVVEDSLDQFVSAIAEGRGLESQEVRRLADGRVYTGSQARELGLIDDFGGLEDAIDLAAELAGIEGEPHVVRYGRPRGGLLRYLRGYLAKLEQSGGVEERIVQFLTGKRPSLTIQY